MTRVIQVNIVRFAILAAFAAFALAGCSVLDEMTEQQPPKPMPVAERKASPRELGSLWSDDSMWNYVYTNAAARVVGDIITIRVDENFRKRVAQLRDGGDQQADTSSEAAPRGGEPGPTTSVDSRNVPDTLMRGSIEQVGTRGVYRITASDTLRLERWEPFVVIKGRVRDRDIDTNDEIRISDIVDLSFEVLKTPPIEGEGGKGLSYVTW